MRGSCVLFCVCGRVVTAIPDQKGERVTEAQRLRDEAAQHERDAAESWERSDTDGFLSQWASGLNAQLKRRQAELIDAGGVATFPGLYDRATGERVRAKVVYVEDRYSYSGGKKPMWLVLDAADNAVMWLPAYKGDSKRSKLWKQGFEERDEQAPAVAFMDGAGRGLSGTAWVATKRTDGGYPESAKLLAELRSKKGGAV